MVQKEDLARLLRRSTRCLSAMGDETRQAIVLTLLSNDCAGMRVGDLARQTHLSQPAISLHLKILCDAGILTIRKQGTKHYYQFDLDADTITAVGELCAQLLLAIQEKAEREGVINHEQHTNQTH